MKYSKKISVAIIILALGACGVDRHLQSQSAETASPIDELDKAIPAGLESVTVESFRPNTRHNTIPNVPLLDRMNDPELDKTLIHYDGTITRKTLDRFGHQNLTKYYVRHLRHGETPSTPGSPYVVVHIEPFPVDETPDSRNRQRQWLVEQCLEGRIQPVLDSPRGGPLDENFKGIDFENRRWHARYKGSDHTLIQKLDVMIMID